MSLVEQCKYWDWCPRCREGLDTGLQCANCGYDLMPVQVALAGAETVIDSLSRRLLEAKKDSERLDYLQAHPRFGEIHLDSGKVEQVHAYAVSGVPGLKLREIVDLLIEHEAKHLKEKLS